MPPVSVIVCAHDEEENLRELIPALLSQDYPHFEVIVVNDRSNDNTYDFLLEETQKDSRLKMVNVKSVPDHVNNKKFAITLGIRAAVNEWILLTDADCRPVSSNWIKTVSERFDSNLQLVLGFSPYSTSRGFLNAFIRFESLITAIQYLGLAAVGSPYMGVGRNLAYRKSLFLEKKGFNQFQHVIGGDDDLFVNQHSTSKNTAVVFSPESVVTSKPKTSWKSFFYQKVRHLSVGKKYKAGNKLILGLFMLSWTATIYVGITAAVLHPYYYVILAGILLQVVFLLLTIHKIARLTGSPFSLWLVPVLDFIYPIYYISTGLVALVTRKVRWKN